MTDKLVLSGKETRREVCDKDLDIQVLKDADCTLILTVQAENSLNIRIYAEENAGLVLFYQNRSKDVAIHEEAQLAENSRMKVAYCDLESLHTERTANYRLQGQKSSVTVYGGALCQAELKNDVTCVHEAIDTISDVSFYSLVLKDGSYSSEIIGQIQRGSKGAKAHQATRVLSFGEKERVQVLPVLKIDENDVEASHALSIGQLDEAQLYYLQSRGLSEKEALRLLATGYLMPLANVADDVALRQELTALIERKVEEVCSM